MAPLGPLQQATAIMLHHHHQHLNHASSNVNNHYELNHHHHLKTNKQDHNHHHHLDLTSANNFLMSGQQHAQNTLNHHGRSSDQYGSLNLSSVGSSVSSAHHSPIMERHLSETTHQQQNGNNQNQNHNNNNNNKKREPDEHERAFGQLTISTEMNHRHHHNMTPNHQLLPTCSLTSSSEATSDYIGSLPCSPASPIESSIGSPPKLSAEVELLLNSGGASPDERSPSCSPTCSTAGGHHLLVSALAPCYHTSLNYHHSHNHLHQQTPTEQSSSTVSSNTNLNSNSNSNNNHLLRPLGHQHQQQAKKVRSFSHSTSFSPLVNASSNNNQQKESQDKWSGSETRERGRLSSTSSRQSPASCEELNQPKVIERPRRLSRIENRQSLHDLGYGRQESYFKLQRLGKGTYATVYMGRSRVNNDLVALKEILKEHDEGAPCTAIREVSLLRLLRHNNIVTLHDICHTPNKLTLVFEYVGPDLYAYMKENNHLLSIHNVRLLLYQLLRGISFCHSRQVLHRDLKPQNLLINSRGELKICDFGLARAKSIPTKSYSNEVVTLWYRPPDVLLGNTDYDHSIDMWGVGCIFYELASGRTFFPGSSVRQQLYLIFSSLGAPSPRNWPEILSNAEYLSYSFPAFRPEKLGHKVPRLDHEGVQLLQSFLRFKPSERISAETARRSSFFAGLPERVHHLHERESIFDVAGVCMSLNPGQKLSRHHRH